MVVGRGCDEGDAPNLEVRLPFQTCRVVGWRATFAICEHIERVSRVVFLAPDWPVVGIVGDEGESAEQLLQRLRKREDIGPGAARLLAWRRSLLLVSWSISWSVIDGHGPLLE